MTKHSFAAVLVLWAWAFPAWGAEPRPQFSGVYPHLAYFNNEGECGTGAVVPWAERLWVITYGPHLPNGSSDKLYEIDASLNITVRPESIGGTPAKSSSSEYEVTPSRKTLITVARRGPSVEFSNEPCTMSG